MLFRSFTELSNVLLDAANDAHSACIVAQHIESKANSMDPSQRQASETYMFHVIESTTCSRPISLHNEIYSRHMKGMKHLHWKLNKMDHTLYRFKKAHLHA